jgi:ubiquinone/menaquinone biosynthesis C-methylase UbiE
MNKSDLSDGEFVSGQYTTPDKITCRIDLHNKYSENKYGWHKWVFDQIDFPAGSHLLELGCGPGTLWADNLQRIPRNSQILLSDLSIGLTNSARKNLAGQIYFSFLIFNAQEIPLQSANWDIVVANHMIYHLPDKNRALSEIKRVLKPGRKLYASTVGQYHMKEISELVNRFNSELAWWKVTNTFLLDDGINLLKQWFPKVEQRRYRDSLLVTNPDDLTNYILSGTNNIEAQQILQLREFVYREFDKCGGVFRVIKDSGIFIAY